MANKESVVESAFVQRVKDIGGIALKLNCIGFRFMPDRMCLFKGGIIHFVEVKTDEGRLSKGQVLRIKWLRSWGFSVFVLVGKQQIEAIINAIDPE